MSRLALVALVACLASAALSGTARPATSSGASKSVAQPIVYGYPYADRCPRAQALCSQPGVPVVLQSTEQGLKIYERMGFRAITRILVYNSAPQ